MRNRKLSNDKHSNILIGITVIVIVIVLCVVFRMKSNDIKSENRRSEQQISELKEEIESEKNRADELDEYEKYTNTKQFVEDMARAKFGLIFPNEIIFKPIQ